MNSSSDFLKKLNISNQDFVELEPKKINKVFLSGMCEGYGYLQHISEIYKVVNSKYLYPISDGFLYNKRIFDIPEEQVFYNPKLSFWWVWNVLWQNKTGNCPELLKLHNGNIEKVTNKERKRELKFISLNRNLKTGRDIFVESLSNNFLKENWITGHFSKRKNLKNDKLINNKFTHFYNIIFNDLNTKGYIQPFFESTGLNDGFTDKILMITEKSCIPFLLGNIAIPMNLFYVSEYEKLGFKFVKNINGVSINETIDWNLNKYDKTYPEKWLKELTKKINYINESNTLQDIEKVYQDNYELILHNQNLVKELMTDNSVVDELKQWIEK